MLFTAIVGATCDVIGPNSSYLAYNLWCHNSRPFRIETSSRIFLSWRKITPNHNFLYRESKKIVLNIFQAHKKFFKLQKPDRLGFCQGDLTWYQGLGRIFTQPSTKKVKLNKTSIGSPIYGYGRPSKTFNFSKANDILNKFWKQKLISIFSSVRIYQNLIFAMFLTFI